MFVRMIVLLLCGAVLFSLPRQTSAEEQKQLPEGAEVTYKEPVIKLYDELFLDNDSNVPGSGTLVKSEDWVFLHVKQRIDFKLPKNTKIHIDRKTLNLLDDQGKAYKKAGQFHKHDKWFPYVGDINIDATFRDYTTFECVFPIPRKHAKTYLLQYGWLKEQTIEVPRVFSQQPKAADDVQVQVKGVSWVASYPGDSFDTGDGRISTTFTTGGGEMLAVSMAIIPLVSNTSKPDRFSWKTTAISIRDDQGTVLLTHGEDFLQHVGEDVNHSSEVNHQTPKPTTFFFSAHKDIKSFEVLWHGWPVATYQIKK